MLPTPERVVLGDGRWLVWVAVPQGVQWNWSGVRGACEPKEIRLVLVKEKP